MQLHNFFVDQIKNPDKIDENFEDGRHFISVEKDDKLFLIESRRNDTISAIVIHRGAVKTCTVLKDKKSVIDFMKVW